MSKSIFGLIITLLLSLEVRAEQPIFNISSVDADPGEIIDVNFHVDNFSQIISVQYSVNWNPAVLEFRTLKNFSSSVPGLTSSVFGTPQALIDAGKFTLSWLESSITPITIPDGSLFFTVEFEVVGTPCQNSPVAITNDPLEIEVAEEGDVLVGLVSNNGEVNVPGTGCAQDIAFIGNAVNGPCGGSACIQFTVENFVTVGAMEFSLVYDPAVLEFVEFKNFAPLPSFGSGNTNLLTPGTLRVLWFDSNAENDTLPDGTVMFEVCFNVIGTGGQFSEITFGNNPSVMIVDIDGNPHEVSITPAVITAQCQLEGFALIADTVCVMPDGTVCIDIKINDFDELVALQFSMNWDSTVFEFDHVEALGIPGLMMDGFGFPGNPGVKEGQLAFAWFDPSLEGVTLPDFSTIFRLCLNAVGAAGTSSPIIFSADPLEIEIATLDSVLVYGLLQGLGEIKTNCGPCEFSYTLVTVPPTCAGDSNGVLNLTVIESCPDSPTYLWSNDATTQDLTGVPAGTYTVTITLGTQVVIATETLTDPIPIAATANITNPVPAGGSNGSIDITVTGGTPPYSFQWSTPPGGTSEDLLNLSAGSYTVTITDNVGCSFTPDPYIVGAELVGAITNVTCNGGSNGAINLSVAFGTAPHTYAWNTTPPSTTEDINNLKAGQYCVTVTDNTGSTRDTCFVVNQPNALVVTATITNDIEEDCQGVIDLNVLSGGTLPYTYAWSNGDTSQDIIECAGQYCVTITDGNGCTMDTCFNIFAGAIGVSLTATQYGDFQVSCNGICDGEITSVVVGGNNVTYLWSNGATTDTLINVCAGTYTLTVTDASAGTATATIVIDAPPPFVLSFITTSPSDYITSDGAIAVVVNDGGSPPYTFQWSGPAQDTTQALQNVPAGTYTIDITDANGCHIRDAEQLLPDVDVPCNTSTKVFTPNSDGKNDYFLITCVLDFDNRLAIFNRQGGLVYEVDNYQNTWIGVDQDGEALPDGAYMWVLEIFKPDGSIQLEKGTVNLLRTAD